ncbi:MAG: DUF6896 domain-containing protein [Aureispira sp.]
MNTKKKLMLEIMDFVANAHLTTKSFERQFSLDFPPIQSIKGINKKIPKNGYIFIKEEEIYYEFHGHGCRFIFPVDRVIDIDYNSKDGTYDGRFGFYNIKEYIISVISEFTNDDLLEEALQGLEEDGCIIAVPRPQNFKEKIAGSLKKVAELEKIGFFEKFNKPRYKAYKIKESGVSPQEPVD